MSKFCSSSAKFLFEVFGAFRVTVTIKYFYVAFFFEQSTVFIYLSPPSFVLMFLVGVVEISAGVLSGALLL